MHKHRNWRKFLPVWAVITLLICLLGDSLPFNIISQTASAADGLFYDFIAQAPSASWMSGAGSLSFPGSDSDNRGFALFRDGWQLEDNSTRNRALETHPQWVSGGWIMGKYPQLTVPANAELKITVGFFKEATGSDGVIFKVQFEEGQTTQTLITCGASYDSKLDTMTQSLSSLEGKTGRFILYVDAGQSSGQDWAAWAEAGIEVTPPALPDLVITEAWTSDNQIFYTVKNIGQGVAEFQGAMGSNGFMNALFIDGTQVAEDLITAPLNPGEQLDRSFYYQWVPTATEHTIKVCADQRQSIVESNEDNNCWQDTWLFKLPDLIVGKIECSPDNNLIITIINAGDAALPTDWIVGADVYFDGVKQGFFSLLDPSSVIDGGIETPGGASTYLLGWDITSEITVKVVVDPDNSIIESDEQNNIREEALTPVIKTTRPILSDLEIISGPIMSNITNESVVIYWETNIKADSIVTYDILAGKGRYQLERNDLVTTHSITVTSLEAGTSYSFVVFSTDAMGTTVNSKTFRFTTATASDKQKPDLSLNLPERLAGHALIIADTSDDDIIDRVVFFLNGVSYFTDYSAPFEWSCDTSTLEEGINEFGARAYDTSGNYSEEIRNGDLQRQYSEQLSPMHVEILSPEEDAGLFMVLDIRYQVTNDYGFKWKSIYLELDGVVFSENIYTNPVTLPKTNWVSYPDVELTYGEHILEVSVEDEYGNWGSDSVRFMSLEPPSVTVTREVTRINNYFQVMLNLHNSGEVAAENVQVLDISHGYQCAEGIYIQEVGTKYTGRVTNSNVSNDPDIYWKSTMNFTISSIEPDDTVTVRYYVVPILVDPRQTDTFLGSFYCIGSKLTLNYRHEVVFTDATYITDYYIGWHDSDERSAAFAESDYLMLTCPTNLFDNYDTDEVNNLLAAAARLAQYNRAVFGFVSSSRVAEGGWCVKDVIRSRSTWARRLCPNWAEGAGFLLIIGEKDVIPAFDIPGLHQVDPDGVVRDTDYPYADTYGDDHIPELTVGRIIGKNAEDMIIPIRTSLGYNTGLLSFSRDSGGALLVSGPEFGEDFANYTLMIGSILENQGLDAEYILGEYYTYEIELLREALVLRGDYTCIEEPGHILYDGTPCTGTHPPTDLEFLRTLMTVEEALELHYNSGLTGDYTIYDTICDAGDARGESVKASAIGKNIIYWFGHGGPDVWGFVIEDKLGSCGSTDMYIGGDADSSIIPIDFGNTCPVVFAASCLTGAYDRQAGRSIARAFLRYGAGIYIGNVEVQGLGACQEMPLAFFRNYWNSPYVYPAEALKNLKATLVRTSFSRRSWDIYEMNLYGDPKFGAW